MFIQGIAIADKPYSHIFYLICNSFYLKGEVKLLRSSMFGFHKVAMGNMQ